MRFKVLVKDAMKKDVKTVDRKAPIESVAAIMREYNIGSVIIMDGSVVSGIVTMKDIVYKHVASGTGRVVGDIMSVDIVTIPASASIEEAATLMQEKGIERLPVVENGSLIGIISSNDILRIEPALFDLLLEKMKIGNVSEDDRKSFGQCENCGNYSDNLTEQSGIFVCEECVK